MENASKALLIAGGVFFAMLIISLMIYMSESITGMSEAQENKKAAEQLSAFNREYEVYNKKLMYGTDVVTVINKAKEDKITIIVNGLTIIDSRATLDEVRNNIKKARLDPDSPDYEALRIFECTNIDYNEDTGKVMTMYFMEKSLMTL